MTRAHHTHDLIKLFAQCFGQSHQTQLVCGTDEPLYLPACATQPWHQIIFAHGYFSSALHECAHWFIAGHQRRLQTDYGYWYVPEGRNHQEQRLFEQVEIKPQALEWILAKACDYHFHFSLDNFNATDDSAYFKTQVYAQVQRYCTEGLPERAQLFRQALCQFYQTEQVLKKNAFLAPV